MRKARVILRKLCFVCERIYLRPPCEVGDIQEPWEYLMAWGVQCPGWWQEGRGHLQSSASIETLYIDSTDHPENSRFWCHFLVVTFFTFWKTQLLLLLKLLRVQCGLAECWVSHLLLQRVYKSLWKYSEVGLVWLLDRTGVAFARIFCWRVS